MQHYHKPSSSLSETRNIDNEIGDRNINSKGKAQPHLKNIFQRNCLRLLVAAGVIWLAALFLPAFKTSDETIYGIWMFLTGWLGFIIFQFAWYANPVNFLAILLSKNRPYLAILTSLLAFSLALMTFIFYEIPAVDSSQNTEILERLSGTYLWLASHALVLLALILNFISTSILSGNTPDNKKDV